MVGLATCWLHPQAIYGLPPSNEASLGIFRQGCFILSGMVNRHVGRLKLELEGDLEQGKLGLGKDRQDLCDHLEARNAERETGGRCLTDDSIKEVDVPFPPWFSFTL